MTTGTSSWSPNYLGNRQTRRRFLAGASAGAAGAALLVACGGGGQGGGELIQSSKAREPGTVWFSQNDWKLADETSEAVKGGVYPGVATVDNVGGFDIMLNNLSTTPYTQHVHEYLMGARRAPGVDPSSPEASVPVPMLAESMEMTNDGTTVTFALRPNVKFHPIAPVNGRVMDIDDWKTTFERFMALSPVRTFLEEFLDKAEYPDARHMVLKLKQPYAPLIDLISNSRFAFPILPKELNTNPSLAASTAIGTGFKILDKYQPAITTEYRKHADYWDREPFIDRWHYPMIPEYANRYSQFVAGNIAAFTPTPRDIFGMAKDAPGAVIVGEEITPARVRRFNFGRDNAANRAYKDARVRIAMRRSVDWNGIAGVQSNKAAFDASGIPVELASTTHASREPLWWLDPEKGELGALSGNYLYDVAEAKKLTAAAGFNNPIDFNWWILLNTDGSEPEAERLMIDSMKRSGIFDVKVVSESNRTRAQQCYSLRQCDGIMSTGSGEYWLDYFMQEQHSRGNRPGGEIIYPNPEIDRAADAYRREIDLEKRAARAKEYQMLQAGYFSMIPAYHEFTTFSFRWPWMHNINWGGGSGAELAGSATAGPAPFGAHLVWLSPDMPRRNG